MKCLSDYVLIAPQSGWNQSLTTLFRWSAHITISIHIILGKTFTNLD